MDKGTLNMSGHMEELVISDMMIAGEFFVALFGGTFCCFDD
jgi:hypothetical protein